MRLDRILLARTDRIGDAVLITPAVRAVKKAYPQCHLTVMTAPAACPVFESNPYVDEILAYDVPDRYGGPGGLLRLTRMMRRQKSDAVIFLFPAPRLSFACWLAAVPLRVGTGYRFWSFLYNRKVFVHRADCAKHEAAYNLDLLSPLGISSENISPEVYVTAAERQAAEQLLAGRNVRLDKPVIVVHPGSRGSALAWPAAQFHELLARIISEELGQVVVVGVRQESALARQVMGGFEDRVADLVGATTLRELAGILSTADVFVGNSSGPMHLAAAVSTQVVGLFSPITVEGPTRWGPIGEHHRVLQPDCDGGDADGVASGRDPACMERIKVEDVLGAVRSLLRKTR